MNNVRPRYMDFCRKSSNPASFYPRRMSAYTGFLTRFPWAETEDFRKFCRGGRLCPPAECSVFSEIFGKSATFIGPTESSAPTRRGTNLPKGFRACSCLLQTPHNESDRQNRTGLPRVRQAGSVGVEKKEEREERKEKIGLLTSMSIPANHVGTVNESERICELSPHFIPNYCTFFVATISTPVPAAFVSSTSPIFTGACAVT